MVRVTFTDDAGNAESLTSAATAAVAPRPPLTASLPNSRFQSARHKGADDRAQVIVAFSMAVASLREDDALGVVDRRHGEQRETARGGRAGERLDILPGP